MHLDISITQAIVFILINVIGWAFALGVSHQKGKSGRKTLGQIQLKLEEKDKADREWYASFSNACTKHTTKTTEEIKTLDRTINNGLTHKIDKAMAILTKVTTDVEWLKTFHK